MYNKKTGYHNLHTHDNISGKESHPVIDPFVQ